MPDGLPQPGGQIRSKTEIVASFSGHSPGLLKISRKARALVPVRLTAALAQPANELLACSERSSLGGHGISVAGVVALVGLAIALDGGDDNGSDGGGDGNDSLDDVLTGPGTARVFGGAGDDDLTLEDQAVGLGGAGNDTIYAQDDAVGYGLKGNDSLTGADKATIKGGEGDDWLELSGDAHGDGGEDNDTLTAEGRTSLYGGDGDDMMSGQGTLEGGSGNNRLGLSYARDVSTDCTKILLYGQADGGDGNDTIIASSGVQDGDTDTTRGTMGLNGGAGG